MELKETFNGVISDYAEARPKYPDQLYADIIAYSGINNESPILEIGAGTGQSTDYYYKNYYNISALEIGKDQVDYLNNKYRFRVNIIHNSFEEFNEGKFDLIFSGTSFHWIKPEHRYSHSYKLLNDNGTLAIYWVTSLNRKIDNKLHFGIQEIASELLPKIIVFYPDLYFDRIHQYRSNEIKLSGLFKNVTYNTYYWHETYSAERYVKLLNTFEYIQALPNGQRIEFLTKVTEYLQGREVVIPQKVELYCMKKI